MRDFLPYLISVNLLILLQVMYFRLFLISHRRFMWNRFFLLGGMITALVLPLIRLDILPPSVPVPADMFVFPPVVIGAAQPAHDSAHWSISDIFTLLYISGAVIALVVMVLRTFKVISLIIRGRKTRHEDYTLVTAPADFSPASWFRYIFWDEGHGMDARAAAVALAHERCHSRQLHSLDLLAAELFKAFCWMNPAVYMLRRDLRRTHEFLADQAAAEVAGTEGIREMLLARQLGSTHLYTSNSFYSHIKARMMILTEKNPRKSLMPYMLILPFLAIMAACTSIGHPRELRSGVLEEKTSSKTVAASTPSDANAYHALEDVLLRAELGPLGDRTHEQALVCLGANPRTLNLDSLQNQQDTETASTDFPQMLNRDLIVKRMGYPQEAKDQDIKGKVVVKILVDHTGRVARYMFLEENHALLRDAVAAHIEELLFKPGKEDGKNTEWWVVVPFVFGVDGC